MTSKPSEVSCDICTTVELIPETEWYGSCQNDECLGDGILLLAPVKIGKRYVRVECKTVGYRCVDSNALFVSCGCCNLQFAVGHVVVEVRNKQFVYGSTVASCLLRKRCEQLQAAREKIEELKNKNGQLQKETNLVKIELSKKEKAASITETEKEEYWRDTLHEYQNMLQMTLDRLKMKEEELVKTGMERDDNHRRMEEAQLILDTFLGFAKKEGPKKNVEKKEIEMKEIKKSGTEGVARDKKDSKIASYPPGFSPRTYAERIAEEEAKHREFILSEAAFANCLDKKYNWYTVD